VDVVVVVVVVVVVFEILNFFAAVANIPKFKIPKNLCKGGSQEEALGIH
jgi:hypothetical protein